MNRMIAANTTFLKISSGSGSVSMFSARARAQLRSDRANMIDRADDPEPERDHIDRRRLVQQERDRAKPRR